MTITDTTSDIASKARDGDRVAFYFDERTLWFDGGAAALVFPHGG